MANKDAVKVVAETLDKNLNAKWSAHAIADNVVTDLTSNGFLIVTAEELSEIVMRAVTDGIV